MARLAANARSKTTCGSSCLSRWQESIAARMSGVG
jgi:hypothetical protein